MKFSFVIPNYNRYDLVHTLLLDIYQKCSPVHEVIIVNDGCTQEESFTGLDWWINNEMLPVREIRIEENVGFLLASNEGLKDTDGDIVCLISNDVRIRNDIVRWSEYQLRNYYKSLVGGRVLEFDTGWNTFNGKIFPYVEGWLLTTWKNNWEELGYFDEMYVPNDYEDLDLSTTAKSLGYGLISIPEDMTFHHGAQSIPYGEKRNALTERNREKFRKKWNLV